MTEKSGFFYLTLEMALATHRKTIDVSGGGTYGSLNVKQLESVLEHIQNDDYYPTLVDKLTHLFFSVCRFHCFCDGNKRLAISLTAQMLLCNGYLRVAKSYFEYMENISYNVAAGKIDKELLRDIFYAYLHDEIDESIQLRILDAIAPLEIDNE